MLSLTISTISQHELVVRRAANFPSAVERHFDERRIRPRSPRRRSGDDNLPLFGNRVDENLTPCRRQLADAMRVSVNSRHERVRREAADVVAHRPIACARVGVGDEDAAGGNAIAVVRVGRNHDQPHAGEARGVDDLAVEDVLGIREERRREEEAHRHVPCVLGLQFVVARAVPAREVLPVVRVPEFLRDFQRLCVRVLVVHNSPARSSTVFRNYLPRASRATSAASSAALRSGVTLTRSTARP